MTSSSEQTVEQRIENAIMRALGIRVADTATVLRMGSTPGWDSMGHMLVVIEVEKEFQIMFPTYRLPELVDVPSIAKAVQGSQAK